MSLSNVYRKSEKAMTQHKNTLDFTAALERFEGVGTWTFLTVPFDAETIFGKKGQVKVTGTINGVAYRNSLMPHGNGQHFLVVNKSIRDKANAQVGDTVAVTMSLDTGERHITAPVDLQEALSQNASTQAVFNGLSYSRQKEYIDWIEKAKREETRASRITKAIGELQGQHAASRSDATRSP